MAYTNTETDTGIRWIDGRPVYCKTFRGAYLVDGDGNGTVLGYISDLGEVVRFDGYVRRADSDTIMSLNYPYFNNSQQMIAVNVRNDGAAVSYTHLDVYKRQSLLTGCGARGSRTCCACRFAGRTDFH